MTMLAATTNQALERDVIGAGITVHKMLGPGFIESVYENALCYELGERGISFERQHEVAVCYVGVHRLDLLVEDRLVVELKAVRVIDAAHYATVRSYLRALNKEVGLIINFGIAKLDVRRVTL